MSSLELIQELTELVEKQNHIIQRLADSLAQLEAVCQAECEEITTVDNGNPVSK